MTSTLVIGIGNTLRGDDGAGVRVAEQLAQRCPAVTVLAVHQLAPELAETLTRFRRVVFVDASLQTETLRIGPVSPALPGSARGSHAVGPGHLLELAGTLYGATPDEVLIAEIPATDFEFGDRFSPPTAAAAEECVERLRQLLQG
jgi:hydrogenase maturation protease